MDNDKTPAWEIWATRLVTVGIAAALAAFVVTYEVPGQGKLLDIALAALPWSGSGHGPKLPAPERVSVLAQEPGPARTMVMTEQKLPAAAEETAVAVEAQPAAPARTSQAVAPHLNTSLRQITTYESGQRSGASASAAAPAAAQAQDAAAPAAEGTSSAPAAIAARSSYGAASRNEMMGRAAGPVYNLKGKAKRR